MNYPDQQRAFRADANRAREIFLRAYEKIMPGEDYQPGHLNDEVRALIQFIRKPDRDFLASEWDIHFQESAQNQFFENLPKLSDNPNLEELMKIDKKLAMSVMLSAFSSLNQ